MKGKPLTNLLVKPAGPDCNLDCGYCFYRSRKRLFPGSENHRMSDTVLEEAIRQLLEAGPDPIAIGWQGGEPTLMGVAFFQRAVDLMARHGRGQAVGNGLQTNGLLLDRDWARFLRKYRFLVGLSLDGPQHVHDRYRTRPGGGGTWRTVLDRAAMLLDEGVSVNALCVVNDRTARFPEEVYRTLREAGLRHMQFIPCVESDPADPGRAAPFSVTAEAYGRFLCGVFDCWRGDFERGRPTTSIRFFEALLARYAGFEPSECTLLAECGTTMVLEHNGDVFACDFFVEPRWRLGNIATSSLQSMLNSEVQIRFGLMKSRWPDRCDACRWAALCRGGCTKDRLRDPRDRGMSHFCASYRIFFEHANDDLEELVRAWREDKTPRAG